MSIITDIDIKPVYNKECIFCFEDINTTNTNETTNNLKLNTSKIILKCNHNYHSVCFFRYIISKLINVDDYVFLKYKKFKCPLCQSKIKYWTLYKIIYNYIKLLKNDVKSRKRCINKKSLNKNCKKVEIFIKNILNKEIFLHEIYEYYKSKKEINKLKDEIQEILSMIYILQNITIC